MGHGDVASYLCLAQSHPEPRIFPTARESIAVGRVARIVS